MNLEINPREHSLIKKALLQRINSLEDLIIHEPNIINSDTASFIRNEIKEIDNLFYRIQALKED